VHLQRQRRCVLAAWCSGVSVTDVACLDVRRVGAPYVIVVVFMVGLAKGFATFLHHGDGYGGLWWR
jgi:hypothetical protein